MKIHVLSIALASLLAQSATAQDLSTKVLLTKESKAGAYDPAGDTTCHLYGDRIEIVRRVAGGALTTVETRPLAIVGNTPRVLERAIKDAFAGKVSVSDIAYADAAETTYEVGYELIDPSTAKTLLRRVALGKRIEEVARNDARVTDILVTFMDRHCN